MPPRRLSVRHRPGRHAPPTPEPAGGLRLLPAGPAPWPGTRPSPVADGPQWSQRSPRRPEWSLRRRAAQLYLGPATLAEDLARIGLRVPADELAVILTGDQPVPAVVLAGLVEVLELRDPTVADRPLVRAVAWSWRRAGWPVPTEVLSVLATARNLTLPEVQALTMQDTPAP